MNIIIPYVLWVALLLFLVDLSMRVIEPQTASLVPRGVSSELIELENVCVEYQVRGHAPKKVLEHLDLSISRRPVRSRLRSDGLRQVDDAADDSGRRTTDQRADSDRGSRTPPPRPSPRLRTAKYSLFPDKTVLDNITFGPEMEEFGLLGRVRPRFFRRRAELRKEAYGYLRQMGLQQSDAGQVSGSALGRNATEGRDCAGSHHEAEDPSHG